MMLLLSNKTAPREPSSAVQPLVLMKKTTLMPSLTSFTKCFLSKAFPSPRIKLWGAQSSPTGVDDPIAMNVDDLDSEDARGDICEIVVVAIQKVINLSAGLASENDRVSTVMASGRLQKSSIWGSTKWQHGQLQLPHHMVCSVRRGTTTKVSTQADRSDNEFIFDEKFIFERREKDEQYHEVSIQVLSVGPGFSKKHCLGQVTVDLDAAFTTVTTEPIYRHSALQTDDSSKSGMEIYYVLHRLVVKNAKAAAASRILTRSSTSLNDDDDMDAYGQIFPNLWYLC
ncbi:unnamed protein product [Peronospora belbahrii]|uniref:C2 domain-containing protein n=1 Tax=Peronospora belbahrii TaxID=622444 RepID=A0AAU9KZQ2_9STRA|nr:unnamed protein product [Peronospora belbahrii]CAH0519593.1 unnamed protein product [Peronospora belbahrii]